MMAIGKFDVLGPLGKGAGSTVLKIRRHSDGATYALKVIKVADKDDRIYIEQAQLEFEVGSKLDHPNLCKVHDLELEKTLFGGVVGAKVLLEFIDGVALADCPKLPIPKLLVVFAKAAAGMAHMHGVGFYHADIKPDNIMVTAKGVVKIIDYGVAWRRGEKKGRIQGTLEFLAPEQARKKIVNAKTDIFNFGASMYRMFTGGAIPDAFHLKGSSKYGNLDDLVVPVADANPNVPKEVDQLVLQCLRYKASERPESMKAVFRTLKELAVKYTGRK
jgi:serine/threonine protein kinase